MSSPPRRIPVRYFLLLREVLQKSGVSIAQVVQSAGIDEAVFRSRDGYLAGSDLDSFIATASKLTGKNDLAFELGRRIKMNSHDVLGYGLLSCASVHEFLSMASRHFHLIDETWTMSYRRYNTGAECVYTPCVPIGRGALHFTMELLAVAHQNHLHLLLGGTEPAYDIHLTMPAPAHVARYAELMPARFHFHGSTKPAIRVVMGTALLDRPLPWANPDVVREVEERCSTFGKANQPADINWVELITLALREAQGEYPTLKTIALRFNVSARTIDRQLKKEGLGYRELVDKVRFERACEMLGADKSSIVDIALSLGFSDAANFSRAFKRVIGIYPSEYQSISSPS